MESTPNFEQMQEMLKLASKKQDIRTNLSDMINKEKKSLDLAFGDRAAFSDFIQENLKPYTLNEVKMKCSNPIDKDFVNAIFTDCTGNVMEPIMDFESDSKRLRFKADLLVYLKVSQEGLARIEEEERKLDEATKELNMNIEDVCAAMSDNIIAFVEQKKDEANALENEVQKNSILKMLKYIESGYTFELIKEPYIKYPNAAYNAFSDFSNSVRSRDIIDRYREKCKKVNSTPSLITLYKVDDMSFEERFLLPEEYKEAGLFIYTLVRFFSMATPDDNFKRLHSTVCVMLNKLIKDDMADIVKDRYLDAVKTVEKIYL